MSTADTKTLIEETFASKLGIEMVSPRIFAELIQAFAGEREVITAVGPSGIGKTAIPKQVAARRNGGAGVPYVALHVPTMSLEDCHIPTVPKDTKRFYDRRISRKFEPILDWVEKHRDPKTKKVPVDMVPIIAIEELNRAADKTVTRALFTLLDDRVIGDVHLPVDIQLVVTMNPSGGNMAVNEFERDPAMLRRLRPLGVDYSYGDFMRYATEADFHPLVLNHLEAHNEWGYDREGAIASKAFACPATWESVSRVCRLFESRGQRLDTVAARAVIASAIGTAGASAFLDFVRDRTAMITPEDVMTGYTPDSEVRKRFRSLFKEEGGRLDKVTELTQGVCVRVFTNLQRDVNVIAPTIALFMSDLPVEILTVFIQRLTEEANTSQDAKNFLTTLNRTMASMAPFEAAMAAIHRAKNSAAEEKQSTKKTK